MIPVIQMATAFQIADAALKLMKLKGVGFLGQASGRSQNSRGILMFELPPWTFHSEF